MVSHQLYLSEYQNMRMKMTMLLKGFLLDLPRKASHSGHQGEKPVATLQGKWTGWDFKFSHENKELAQVTKKWAGMGKELFTSADNYVLNIEETVAADSPLRQLILGAVMCIDMVLKE
jgi:uncharacterized protein YxjI